jgi:hypothetical protein
MRDPLGDVAPDLLPLIDLPLEVPCDVATILCLKVFALPILARDDPTTVLRTAVAWHLIGVVIRRRPIVGEFFTRLDITEGEKDNLSLNANVWVTGVITKEHAPVPLALSQRSDVETISDRDFGRTELCLYFAERGDIKDIAAFDRHDLALGNWFAREEAMSIDIIGNSIYAGKSVYSVYA